MCHQLFLPAISGGATNQLQVPGHLQRLQAFYLWEQHTKADRREPESPVFAAIVSVGVQLRVKWESPGVQLSVIWPTIASGNTASTSRSRSSTNARPFVGIDHILDAKS